MTKRLWHNKWFILAVVVTIFFALTQTKVVLAGTDVQLDKLLKGGLDGLTAYFAWLIDVLKVIW